MLRERKRMLGHHLNEATGHLTKAMDNLESARGWASGELGLFDKLAADIDALELVLVHTAKALASTWETAGKPEFE